MAEHEIPLIIHIIIFILSVLVIVVNLLLIIPIFKLQKTMSNIKPLYIQFLLSFLLFSLNINHEATKIYFDQVNCYLFHILGCFSGPTTGLSLLSIIFHSFFILTNNYFFHKKKQCVILLMVIITWIPSICMLVVFLCFMGSMNLLDCSINKTFYSIVIFILNVGIELITVILCVILLWKVCSLNVKNDQELQVSKKKTVSKLIIYICAVLVGIVLKFATAIRTLSFVKIVCLLYIFYLNHIFIWNKQYKEAFVNVYCCKSVTDSEDKVDENGQKELIFQHDLNEEKLSNFDDSQAAE